MPKKERLGVLLHLPQLRSCYSLAHGTDACARQVHCAAHMHSSGAAGRQQPDQRRAAPHILKWTATAQALQRRHSCTPRRPEPSEGAQLLPGSCATSDAAKESRWPVTEDSRWSLFGKNTYYTFSRKQLPKQGMSTALYYQLLYYQLLMKNRSAMAAAS